MLCILKNCCNFQHERQCSMFKSFDLNWKCPPPYVNMIFKSTLNFSKERCFLHSIYTILYSNSFIIYNRWMQCDRCCHTHFLVLCGYFTHRIQGKVCGDNFKCYYSPSAPQSRFFPHIVWDHCFIVNANSQTESNLDWNLIIAFSLNFFPVFFSVN